MALTDLARHLALPKSSASILVKDLQRRGFVRRRRDRRDERRLSITLTPEGVQRVRHDTVLEPRRLAGALRRLDPQQRDELLRGVEALVEAAATGRPRA